jgi:glycosyltransferase involved in cell wall biosynthesis
MIKILFVSFSGYPSPNVGGPNKIIYGILQNLDYSKFKPAFFSYDAKIDYKSAEDLQSDQIVKSFFLRRSGKKLYEKFSPYRYLTTRPWYLKIHYKKRDKFFEKNENFFDEFDIIHIHDPLAAYYFINVKKTKKIFTIHSNGAVTNEILENNNSILIKNYLKNFKLREKKAFENMDIITFPSMAAKHLYFKDLELIENKKVKIIYNGIDLDYINNILPEQILNKYGIVKIKYDGLILNVGSHIKVRNIDILIQTIKYLKDIYNKNYLLINAGTGYLTSQLQKLVEELKVNSQVKFLGQIPNKDVIRLMKACDLFIMPSERVIFDMVILEALSSGIKVIASADGGNKEIIKDGENGYLIDNISPQSIANIVISNLSLNRFNQNKLITIKEMIKDYIDIYMNCGKSDAD